MKVLVLNAGSSTQKSCLYEFSEVNLLEKSLKPIWEAVIDWNFNDNQGLLTVEVERKKIKIPLESTHRAKGIAQMLNTLITKPTKVIDSLSEINIVGHRVVHGGRDYSEATLITSEVKKAIANLIPLAPSHNPAHLEGIEAIEQLLGDIPQVAVFDTAFHTSIPLENKIYPIPYEWYEKGIQRYGFHGISHQYCANHVAEILNKPLVELKIITCHLGNGCSITAIKNGQSVNTSMGFTPLEGLMMGSRSGSIDPAILIHLMTEYDYTAAQLNQMLNQESGLKGISGISADLRSILEAIDKNNSRAKLAFDIYIHRIKSVIASLLPDLGGLDVLVFTAGIGENAVKLREEVCKGLDFLGLSLNLTKNLTSCVDENIAMPDSQVKVIIVHTQEDLAIAKQCLAFVT